MKDLAKKRSKAELLVIRQQIDALVLVMGKVLAGADDWMPRDAQLYALALLLSQSAEEIEKAVEQKGAGEAFIDRFLVHLGRLNGAEIRVIRRADD